MAGQLKSVVSGVGAAAREYADPARYVLGLDRLPLGRVVNDAKVTDHHAIIPTEGDHDLAGLSRDEQRIYDMVARRFLAVFHPAARFERTVVETRCAEHLFRSRGKVMIEAGWRAAYGESVGARDRSRPRARTRRRPSRADEDEQSLPALAVGQAVACLSAEALAKRTKPPGRFSEGTLLRAMETAGKLVEDDEAAEAMKDAGIGTPATRAATIERLVDAEYIEKEGRGLRATEKGIGLVTDARRPRADQPRADRPLGAAAQPHRARRGAGLRVPRRDRRLHPRGGGLVRRQGARRPARRAHAAGAVPDGGLRGPDRRVPQELRLQHVQGQGRPGLRLHALEAAERAHDHPRRGAGAHRRGPLEQGPRERARDHRPLPHARAAAARSSSARAATGAPAGRAAPRPAADT